MDLFVAREDLLAMYDSITELVDLMGSSHQAVVQLETISVALKRRTLTGSHSCAKATVEILRMFLGTPQMKTAEQMMGAVRAVGKELTVCAPTELSVGNIARRILQIIREEYANKLRGAQPQEQEGADAIAMQQAAQANRRRKERSGSLVDAILDGNLADLDLGGPLGGDMPDSRGPVLERQVSSDSFSMHMQQPSLGSVLGAWQGADNHGDMNTTEFSTYFPDMRQSVMGAVNELNDEIDTIFGPICEQAAEHIHSDDCILAHGWSTAVELFLKAAGRKRKYQVIIAEAEPELSGHKLATALSKVANISVTLIPDSAIYAVLGRVNKVIVAPQAVLADGGSMFSAGHLMVTVAAKDHNVPVIGLAAAFHLTPMFAHNQSETLGQLLSPSLSMQYNSSICQENVEVVIPAYDYVPAASMSLYVTNNGSHQPSYIHRLLGEQYHPSDYGSLL